jgi:hypothetical protein
MYANYHSNKGVLYISTSALLRLMMETHKCLQLLLSSSVMGAHLLLPGTDRSAVKSYVISFYCSKG